MGGKTIDSDTLVTSSAESPNMIHSDTLVTSRAGVTTWSCGVKTISRDTLVEDDKQRRFGSFEGGNHNLGMGREDNK